MATLPRNESAAAGLKGKAKDKLVNVRGEKENVPTASGWNQSPFI
jgi:hypothetical protein